MERRDSSGALTLFSDQPLAAGARSLDEGAAQHARVRRAEPGDAVRVLDGRGRIGRGRIAALGRDRLDVAIDDVAEAPPASTLMMLVPVADRDRMLLAAEKCAELQVSVWQPVVFARSRSVIPRGEGEKFHAKVRARMISALEQSGGAWLPDVRPEIEAASAWSLAPDSVRWLMHGDGAPVATLTRHGAHTVAIGPEGGFEQSEIHAARDAGWLEASLGPTTLRFETAVIAAAAIIRSHQDPAHGGRDGR